jgi:hypothetical protein
MNEWNLLALNKTLHTYFGYSALFKTAHLPVAIDTGNAIYALHNKINGLFIPVQQSSCWGGTMGALESILPNGGQKLERFPNVRSISP